MRKGHKAIPGFPGYAADREGNIWSYHLIGSQGGICDMPQRMLSPWQNEQGYQIVGPSKNGKNYNRRVHQLVMLAWHGPCPLGKIVCHNNDTPTDNRLSNLRYDTYASNARDAIRRGTHASARSFGHVVKLTSEQVIQLRKRRAMGETTVDLAKAYGLTQSWVSKICLGYAHRDVGGPRTRAEWFRKKQGQDGP